MEKTNTTKKNDLSIIGMDKRKTVRSIIDVSMYEENPKPKKLKRSILDISAINEKQNEENKKLSKKRSINLSFLDLNKEKKRKDKLKEKEDFETSLSNISAITSSPSTNESIVKRKSRKIITGSDIISNEGVISILENQKKEITLVVTDINRCIFFFNQDLMDKHFSYIFSEDSLNESSIYELTVSDLNLEVSLYFKLDDFGLVPCFQ
jgi:hypothetical protein